MASVLLFVSTTPTGTRKNTALVNGSWPTARGFYSSMKNLLLAGEPSSVFGKLLFLLLGNQTNKNTFWGTNYLDPQLPAKPEGKQTPATLTQTHRQERCAARALCSF